MHSTSLLEVRPGTTGLGGSSSKTPVDIEHGLHSVGRFVVAGCVLSGVLVVAIVVNGDLIRESVVCRRKGKKVEVVKNGVVTNGPISEQKSKETKKEKEQKMGARQLWCFEIGRLAKYIQGSCNGRRQRVSKFTSGG